VGIKQVKLARITLGVIEETGTLPVEQGVVRLTLPANQPTLISAF
jgi:hypothetical protein